MNCTHCLENVKRKYYSFGFVLYSLFYLSILTGTVQAQITLVFQDGLGGYSGTVDTFINNGNGIVDVFGESNRLEWDGSNNGGVDFGLLRFDDIIGTGPGQIPPNATILNAFIVLEIVDAGDVASLHDILPGTETEPTFFDDANTALLDFGDGFDPAPGRHYVEVPIASVPGEIATLELDVTSSIQRYANGELNTGWIIVPTGGGGVQSVSSEDGNAINRPLLRVQIEGSAPEALRTLSTTRYVGGDTIGVSLDVTVTGGGTLDVTVLETIPTGWTASNISNNGNFAGGSITWQFAGLSGSTTLRYDAQVPADAPLTGTFNGVLNDSFIVFGDASVLFAPPFNPIGVVDVAPGVAIIIQIENGTPKAEPTNYILEGDASTQSGIVLRSLTDGRVDPFLDEDDLQFMVNILQSGTYFVFCSCSSDSGSSDSFFVGFDEEAFNDDFYRFNLGPDDNMFHRQWVTSEALGNAVLDFSLDAGQHTLNWHMREPNARVDWIGITSDPNLDLESLIEPEPVSVENWQLF